MKKQSQNCLIIGLNNKVMWLIILYDPLGTWLDCGCLELLESIWLLSSDLQICSTIFTECCYLSPPWTTTHLEDSLASEYQRHSLQRLSVTRPNSGCWKAVWESWKLRIEMTRCKIGHTLKHSDRDTLHFVGQQGLKADRMHSNGDVPELKDWGEIYRIIYPAGVSEWLSLNPQDLLPDLEVLSLHTTSGRVPEGIKDLAFFFF